MILTLGDLTFRIKGATLSAAVPDPYWCDKYNRGKGKELFWSIDIDTNELDVDSTPWRPSVYHGTLCFPIRHWMEIQGQVVTWDCPYDKNTGESNGGFYVFEHADITKGHLQFLDREGNLFRVEWTGTCNVHWDDQYGENVPFSLQATAMFSEVIVRGNEHDNDNTLRDRLSHYLDPADFVQHPIEIHEHTYESGIRMAECRFEPKL